MRLALVEANHGGDSVLRPRFKRAVRRSLVIGIGLSLAFLGLAVAVHGGATQACDQAVLLSFRVAGDPTRGRGPVWLPETIRDITGLGSTSVLATILVIAMGYLAIAKRWRSFATLTASVLSAEAVCLILKALVVRPRPNLVPGAPEVFTSSVPSSQAMISTLTLFIVAALFTQTTANSAVRHYSFAVAAIVTGMVGMSRIYLGVHWPTDVLGGWLAGTIWTILCWTVASGWCRRDWPRQDALDHRGREGTDPKENAPWPSQARGQVRMVNSLD